MVHISAGNTERTIAFRRENGNYIWIGEQEIFEGPRKYTTEDGTFNEHLTLTYHIKRLSGFQPNQLNVDYRGTDARLSDRNDLSLAIVKPILREWGY
jgi:hypothetical protein